MITELLSQMEDQSVIKQHDANSFRLPAGATNASTCVACEAGKFSSIAGEQIMMVFMSLFEGYVQREEPANDANCYLLNVVNDPSQRPGVTDSSSCTFCLGGTFSSQPGIYIQATLAV
jgi:hypothetical protein